MFEYRREYKLERVTWRVSPRLTPLIQYKLTKCTFSKFVFYFIFNFDVFYMFRCTSTYMTAYTDKCKTHYTIPPSWWWTLGFETHRKHQKLKIKILIYGRCVLLVYIIRLYYNARCTKHEITQFVIQANKWTTCILILIILIYYILLLLLILIFG